MRKRLTGLILFSFLALSGFSQVGGEHIYDFLNLGSSARVAALGGEQVALSDVQPDIAFHNPSLLHPELDQTTILNYVSYLADINYGYASYTRDLKKWGTWSAGIHYINYGKFTEADNLGQITGTFRASEYALLISWAKELTPRIRIGATFKPIYSVLEKYNSFGVATDWGITYNSSDKLFTAALVARNIGYQIQPYYGSHREDLPYEILMGFSQKLAHAPFRLALTYRHLEQFDLSYESPLDQTESSSLSQTGTESSSKDDFVEKTLKHLVFGLEFLPTKNLTVRAGYNFQRRNELKVDAKGSTVGFSWGFGVNISRFHLSYASARYHLAGTTNHFSISTRLSDFNFR